MILAGGLTPTSSCIFYWQVRELKAGDYLWILLPPNVRPDDEEIRPNAEEVLPFIVERKTWDDLQDTLRSNRFENQVNKMIVSTVLLLGLFHLKSYWRGCPRYIGAILVHGGPQKSLISLRDGIIVGPPEYCRVVNFFHLPHFIGFIVVNVRKSHCSRVPPNGWNCRVGDGPDCRNWRRVVWVIFLYRLGVSPEMWRIAAGWSKKSSTDTPP